jgi:hypothetical protein
MFYLINMVMYLLCKHSIFVLLSYFNYSFFNILFNEYACFSYIVISKQFIFLFVQLLFFFFMSSTYNFIRNSENYKFR